MVYDQFHFGEGSLIESGKDAILKAILELGETVDDKVAVLMIAMNDPGVHQLVQYFMLINQAMVEAALPRMHSYAHFSSRESIRSPLNPSTMFPLTTATNILVAVIEVNDAGVHQLVQYSALIKQAMVEAALPRMHSYAHLSSQESARSPLNPSTIFPLTTATNIAVAVIDGSTVDATFPTKKE